MDVFFFRRWKQQTFEESVLDKMYGLYVFMMSQKNRPLRSTRQSIEFNMRADPNKNHNLLLNFTYWIFFVVVAVN